MRSHQAIIAEAGAEVVAAGLPASINSVRSWQRRDSVPSDLWLTFEQHGWATLGELAAHAAANPRMRSADQQAAA